MRERELKPRRHVGEGWEVESLPMRERELKHAGLDENRGIFSSLPMRERELKQNQPHCNLRWLGRSPCGSVN